MWPWGDGPEGFEGIPVLPAVFFVIRPPSIWGVFHINPVYIINRQSIRARIIIFLKKKLHRPVGGGFNVIFFKIVDFYRRNSLILK
jgi:hypothetical protein